MPSPPNPPRIVDFKLTLPWLIGSAATALLFMVTLGWNASAQSSKLDQLILTNAKMEKRLDDRDMRIDAMRDRMYATDRLTDALSLRITALEGQRK
jgi:hypothetical protein